MIDFRADVAGAVLNESEIRGLLKDLAGEIDGLLDDQDTGFTADPAHPIHNYLQVQPSRNGFVVMEQPHGFYFRLEWSYESGFELQTEPASMAEGVTVTKIGRKDEQVVLECNVREPQAVGRIIPGVKLFTDYIAALAKQEARLRKISGDALLGEN